MDARANKLICQYMEAGNGDGSRYVTVMGKEAGNDPR